MFTRMRAKKRLDILTANYSTIHLITNRLFIIKEKPQWTKPIHTLFPTYRIRPTNDVPPYPSIATNLLCQYFATQVERTLRFRWSAYSASGGAHTALQVERIFRFRWSAYSASGGARCALQVGGEVLTERIQESHTLSNAWLLLSMDEF